MIKNKSDLPAALMLEDGTFFLGISCGALGEACGEICFNTSLVGYVESISDPSYAGQIVNMTYPQIGNYGVAHADMQADHLHLKGVVVRDMCYTPSNFRSDESLPELLIRQGVVAIENIDTRHLTRHIRDVGAMRAILSTLDTDPTSLLEKVRASAALDAQNLAATVSTPESYLYQDWEKIHDFALKPPQPERYHVVAYDCGIKKGILRNLRRVGCRVTVVPWDTPADDVIALDPDGIFFSNGPGDPQPVTATIEAARQLFGKFPIFGICLGQQMIGLCAGASIEKLKFGHRGGNQPVMNLRTHRVEITAQNHSFGIVFPSLGALLPQESGGIDSHPNDLRFWVENGIAPVVSSKSHGRIQLTHVNLNDGTPEGLAFLDAPTFCVQYHPEAGPGPTDSHYLFDAFTRLMDGRQDYLDIDITQDRLAEWR